MSSQVRERESEREYESERDDDDGTAKEYERLTRKEREE